MANLLPFSKTKKKCLWPLFIIQDCHSTRQDPQVKKLSFGRNSKLKVMLGNKKITQLPTKHWVHCNTESTDIGRLYQTNEHMTCFYHMLLYH